MAFVPAVRRQDSRELVPGPGALQCTCVTRPAMDGWGRHPVSELPYTSLVSDVAWHGSGTATNSIATTCMSLWEV